MSRDILIRARRELNPVITDNEVTFVWEGANPPPLRGDFNNWDSESHLAWQQETPELWSYTLELPNDAYIEYAYGTDEARIPDPLNPRKVWNGYGGYNAYFYMPGKRPSPLTKRRRDIPRGTLETHQVPTGYLVSGKTRTVHLYRPAIEGPTPLLLVYDGTDFRRRGRLPIIVDNLLAEGRIRPISLAMVAHGRQARMAEYGCSETAVLFAQEVVLPFAAEHLNLLNLQENSGAFGVTGVSMGGLMATYTALRRPHLFGKVLSLSASYQLDPHEMIVNLLLRETGPYPLQLWLAVGRYEWLLAANRRLAEQLQRRNYDFTLHEYNAGHNYSAWRDEIGRGLEWLFPPE